MSDEGIALGRHYDDVTQHAGGKIIYTNFDSGTFDDQKSFDRRH
jgi:hypothetical protein